MSEMELSGVSETSLIVLYLRAMESRRPGALIRDEKAVALVSQMSYDFSWVNQIVRGEIEKVTVIMRNREFDRYARDFLARRPGAVVVHIACGLDARFERVDDGRVEWYDLDLPRVIDLRRKLIGGERERYHLLGCSVFDSAWLDALGAHRRRPCLFLAEGLSMYLEEAQVRSLVLMLRDHFPSAELVFDGYSPLHIWRSNLQISIARLGARFPRLHWGLWRGREVEAWGEGIHLLDDWGYLDTPEPRLARIRWLRHIPLVARAACLYHFRLGEARG